MAQQYGTVKVDNITFTSGAGGSETDITLVVSGLNGVSNSGITVTGTISGETAEFVSGVFTSLSGTTATVTSGVFASGTAAAPSVSVGTTDNGLYSPGTDQVALATSGTGRLFISNDGKVGIGVSDPSSYNVSADDLVIADPNGFNSGISINITDNTGSSNIWFGDSDAEGRGQINYGHGANDALYFWVGGNQNLALYETGGLAHIGGGSLVSPAVSFNGSAPSNSLVIDSTGKLGVGTSSPEAALTVNGNTTVSSQLSVAAKIGTAGASNVLIGTFVSNTPFIASEGANPLAFMIDGVTSLFIDSSRRVLVGTSSARSFDSSSATLTPIVQIESTGPESSFSITRNGNSNNGPGIFLGKSRGGSVGGVTVVNSGDLLGQLVFEGADGAKLLEGASIRAEVDGTPGVDDMPGRLVFSVTADGASSPTEALRISNDRSITVSDGGDVAVGTTTGTKIGTATSQKIGFYNATPVVQPSAVADITTTATSGSLPTPDGSVTIADATTPTVTELLEYCVELEAKLEAALGHLRTLGLIAT